MKTQPLKNMDIYIRPAMFKTMINNVNIPIQYVDKNGKCIETNKAYDKVFGTTAKEDITIFELLNQNDEFIEILESVKKGNPGHFESFYYTISELNFNLMLLPPQINLDIYPLFDGNDEIINYVLIFEIIDDEFTKELNNKSKYIMDNLVDTLWIYSFKKKHFVYMSPSILSLRGITVEEALEQSLEDAMVKESYLSVKKIIEDSLAEFINNPSKPISKMVAAKFKHRDGSEIWLEITAKLALNKDEEIEMIGSSREITGRKKREDEILYMSYHDQLTGLYNRRFYEEELRSIDIKENLPLTILIGDVNGLKLINDSFGHKAGDDLLKITADALVKGCKDEGVVCRLGGDEFAIILTKADFFVAEQIINRIKRIALKDREMFFDLSISFGYDTKDNEDKSIEEVFKNAEDVMYKHKLYESHSMRTKTIDMIMNTLFEKSTREMLHSKRVSDLCEAITIHMNFDQDDINSVKIAGLMHDIGKMGIDEKILNKPRPLSTTQWEEMKQHPEIGYRILNSSNEFSDMANFVLQHHERYDGLGYPNGLKGDEISIEARIIAVADSYDAMTSDRAYRKGLTDDEAIKEIKACSGKQFDPNIAKILVEKVLNKDW